MPSTPLICLLERGGDRGLHHLRVRADVVADDGHLRRREVRELRDGQGGDGDGARQDDEQRADRREDRPADEEVDEALRASPPRLRLRLTGTPSTRICVPETITRSPGLDPVEHHVVVADDRAQAHRPLARHERPCPSARPRRRRTARSPGTRRAPGSPAPARAFQTTRARTNWDDRSALLDSAEGRLDEHRLRVVVDLGRDEAHAGLRQHLAVGVDDLAPAVPSRSLRGPLERDGDVGLEALPAGRRSSAGSRS